MRALIVRIGALGDLLLTRRLTHSLSLAGFESTLLAPVRHATVLLGDPWIEAVLDSESARFASAFSGTWPGAPREFDLAIVISKSPGLADAMSHAAARVVQIAPEPRYDEVSIALQWAGAANGVCEAFTGTLPSLTTHSARAVFPGATFIHPGSGSATKNWPLNRFVELGKRLAALGHEVAWIRGPAEAGFPAESFSGRVIDAPPLDVLAATLARSALFIGNDSGVSHLAAATGAPTVALFGPTAAAIWRPDGPRVVVVSASKGVLDDIPVERVQEAAKGL